MTTEPDISAVEKTKIASNYLRGTVSEELADDNDFVGKESVNLIKHFGTYQQDDRDARANARASGGSGKQFIFMVRTKIPGGKLTSEQLLAELDICDELGNATLRATTRQGLQHHGILKQDLKRTIARINEIKLSTLGACGDVNRNVMCCPAPIRNNPVREQMQAAADALAEHLAPKTKAYYEIFLRDVESGEDESLGGASAPDDPYAVEPIYGRQYLPRKFKIGVGLCDDNCIDIYTHDMGFLAVVRDGQLIGYNVLVGGGQGRTPSADKTFPALAKRMCFITPDQLLDVGTAVVKVQRDFGNRVDRKLARLKYLIHDWGIEKFKAKVEEYYGQPLPDCTADDVHGFDDHMGWAEQGDGRWFYGLNIENGRIKDTEEVQLKTALREVCRTLAPGIRITAHQSLLFTDIAAEDKARLLEILQKHNVKLSEDFSEVRRWSMACVAWPTCGLSITESERALPGMIDQMEIELARLGLSAEQFTVRMTGCPNGCARPYNCDIGLVGKAKDKYTVFVGGRLLGNRLNFIYKDMVPADDVVNELVPVFAYFKQERQQGETLGDFCDRKGVADLLAWAEQYQAQATR